MAATAGGCAYVDKNIPTALEDYYTALFLDPENSDARYGIGIIFYDQGLYDLSLREFEKYLQMPYKGLWSRADTIEEKHIKRERAEAYCFIGDIYEKKGDKKASTTNYKKATETDPEYTKFMETFIKHINDKKEKTEKDFNNLETLTKRLARMREAEKGT